MRLPAAAPTRIREAERAGAQPKPLPRSSQPRRKLAHVAALAPSGAERLVLGRLVGAPGRPGDAERPPAPKQRLVRPSDAAGERRERDPGLGRRSDQHILGGRPRAGQRAGSDADGPPAGVEGVDGAAEPDGDRAARKASGAESRQLGILSGRPARRHQAAGRGSSSGPVASRSSAA